MLKRKEEEDQQMKQLIQTLQAALEKEKVKVRDLKEQVKIKELAMFQRIISTLNRLSYCTVI